MHCDRQCEKLLEFACGELPSDEAEELKSHVAACEACRGEWETILRNGDLLQRATHEASSDLPPLDTATVLASAHRRELRRTQRWRRMAGCASAAAIVLVVLGAAISRVELHATHAVIRWDDLSRRASSPSDRRHADAAIARLRAELAETQAALAEQQRRLDDLDQLAGLIVTQLKDDEARTAHSLAALSRRIEAVRRQSDQRWQAVGRGFHDWYLTQRLDAAPAAEQTTFTPLDSGDSP